MREKNPELKWILKLGLSWIQHFWYLAEEHP